MLMRDLVREEKHMKDETDDPLADETEGEAVASKAAEVVKALRSQKAKHWRGPPPDSPRAGARCLVRKISREHIN